MSRANPTTPMRPSSRSAKRRGTVIVLALAVLAILAIAAVAYVSVVRIDRESSAAVAKQANYEQQVNAAVSHVGSLIVADLFGNKIVTASTPKTIPGGARVWPRAFEDAESWDYPTTDAIWRLPNPPLNDINLDPRQSDVSRRVARPDDAWLASLEPRWNYNNLDDTRYWPQITNLRSAYTWNQRTRIWERGDGRYVDLLQWFLQARNGHANPAIDLTATGDGNNPMGPAFGFDDGNANRNTGVYDKQMDFLDYGPPLGQYADLNPSDERMWVDTDGDLRPDARWQQLDTLGNLYGLNWVVAARVIDASALVNVQTAIEFPYEQSMGALSAGRQFFDVMGTGKTPADVDLLRLLSYSSNVYPGENNARPNIYDANIAITQMETQFEQHLRLSLGSESVIQDLRNTDNTPPTDTAMQNDPKQDYFVWNRGNPLTRLQREALFSYATSTIDRPIAPTATTYPRRDMIDLFTFVGTNNLNILSKLEQRIDGPEGNQGFLPDPDTSDPVLAFGPMRSAERPGDARRFRTTNASQTAEPTTQRIKMDIRRLLTMVSGVGQISPVPVLNDSIQNRSDSFDSQYSQKKIRLADLAGLSPTNSRDQDLVQRVFGSLVWALAPLATNQPLAPGVPQSTAGNAAVQSQSAHYGGSTLTSGPAYTTEFQRHLSNPAINASYAIFRAASMTVNLLDAMDSDGSSTQPRPTALRLFNDPLSSADPTGFQVNTRLTQGDIPANVLPPQYVGEPTAGVTFFGVDHQPFLRQAHALAVYQNPDFAIGSDDPVLVDGDNLTHHLGGIIAFELGNPWPQALDLTKYRIRIQKSAAEWLEFDLEAVAPPGPLSGDASTATVAPGDRVVFYWSNGNTVFDPAWDEILGPGAGTWRGTVDGNGISRLQLRPEALNVNGVAYDPSTGDPVAFHAFGNPTQAPILLIRKQEGDMPSEVIVDRMTPPTGNGIGFPAALLGSRPVSIAALQTAAGDPLAKGCARVAVASTFSRPMVNNKGFPGYLIERRNSNTVSSNVASPIEQPWLVTASGGAPDYIASTLLADPAFLTFMTIGTDVGSITDTAYQVFVPNRPLEYLSELLLISPFCHTYVHRDITETAPNTGNPVLTDAWDMSTSTNNPWTTFSEYLGSDAEFYYDAPTNSIPNPYLGVLDPSRYVLSSGSMAASGLDLTDALTVPLALRVVEPFDALSPKTEGTLVQGRININTAPSEVVACLPLMAPQFAVPLAGSATGGLDAVIDAVNPVNGAPNINSRLSTLIRYRDRVRSDADPNSTLAFQQPSQADLTQITGVRGYPNASFRYSNALETRGFTTTAELAILQPWDPLLNGKLDTTIASTPLLSAPYFMPIGQDTRDASSNAVTGTINQLDTYNPSYGGTSLIAGTADVIDDPEERLAIYRAISNIATTRSDVYIAWIVLRGYDPDIIEGIVVPGGNNPSLQQARDAMNDPLNSFRPTYESRWLVVYDRSNVVKPTDRPRILMQVELPSTKP